MKVPKCCGKRMQSTIETVRFVEVWCDSCDDIVYLKKDEIEKPQILDD